MRPRPLDRDREEPGAGVELEELEPGAGGVEELEPGVGGVEELEPGAGGAEEEEEEKPRVGAGVKGGPRLLLHGLHLLDCEKFCNYKIP